MTRKNNYIRSGRFGESGHFYFSKTEVDARIALCKEALIYKRGINIRFKKIYEGYSDLERCSTVEFQQVSELQDKYARLSEVGYGGEFCFYEKDYLPEGALLLFVRVKGLKRYEFIDEGCIWVGTRFDYPLIFVDNSVANWVCPYSPAGSVRMKPFLPYAQVIKVLPQLMHSRNYPDLEVGII